METSPINQKKSDSFKKLIARILKAKIRLVADLSIRDDFEIG